jgi:hypothetical protein
MTAKTAALRWWRDNGGAASAAVHHAFGCRIPSCKFQVGLLRFSRVTFILQQSYV